MNQCVPEGKRFVGASEETVRLRDDMSRVAPTGAPVLILGETGTGKELVARGIYEMCPRGSFVTVDCSGLAGTLLESELFGHVRGAFTGALENKPGLLSAAHGGTAFFDEIGELPLEFQAKLLRVLQHKEYRPVGAVAPLRSDFRIVAATNRDLATEVDRGTFRRDLYYRLNVVTLRLRPLCERRHDLFALAQHFVAVYGEGHHISGELMDILLAYHWPGNIRELENCICQMLVAAHGLELTPAHLPAPIAELFGGPDETPRRIPPKTAPVAHGIVPLQELEKRAIAQALERTNGDRAAAARMLGIGRTTLYRKLKAMAVGA